MWGRIFNDHVEGYSIDGMSETKLWWGNVRKSIKLLHAGVLCSWNVEDKVVTWDRVMGEKILNSCACRYSIGGMLKMKLWHRMRECEERSYGHGIIVFVLCYFEAVGLLYRLSYPSSFQTETDSNIIIANCASIVLVQPCFLWPYQCITPGQYIWWTKPNILQAIKRPLM